MTFVVDTMLGKLARWLCILGYDAVFDPSLTLSELVALSKETDAVLLTRRVLMTKDVAGAIVFKVESEQFDEQLRQVVERFNLLKENRIFTRCTACNIEVELLERSDVQGKIPEQSFLHADHFTRCPRCKMVYWNGTHRANTLKKLHRIFHNL